MKDRLLKLLPYAAVLAAGFYLFPLFIGDTGSGMLVLLLLLPLTVLTLATLYGGLRGWDFLFPATVAILFTPTLFIFYNPSAWVYIPAYTALAFLGNFVGKCFHKPKK